MKLHFFTSLIIGTVLMTSFSVKAQDTSPTPKSDFWSKVRFGGGLGLNFGTGFTDITVSPTALYQPNPYIAFGPGLRYTYQQNGDLRTSLYGFSGTVLANPLDIFQVSAELEQLNVNQSFNGDDRSSFWNTALFVGAGYRLNIGQNSLGAIGVRYNLLFQEGDGIYRNAWQPFVRVFF